MALISMVVYIAAYSVGIGPVPKTFIGEMLPLRARGKAAGLSSLATYTFVFLSTSCFSYMLVSWIRGFADYCYRPTSRRRDWMVKIVTRSWFQFRVSISC